LDKDYASVGYGFNDKFNRIGDQIEDFDCDNDVDERRRPEVTDYNTTKTVKRRMHLD
jgi:hypothetical protein